MRQPSLAVAINMNIPQIQQPLLQLITQRIKTTCFLQTFCQCQLAGCSQSHNGRHIQCATAQAFLVATAMDLCYKANTWLQSEQ